MEVKLDPKFIEAVRAGDLKIDWKSVAKRVEAQEGKWQMVFVTKRYDKGLAEEVASRLARVGCKARVVVGCPMNQGMIANPDRVVFARIPRSHRTPNGQLL